MVGVKYQLIILMTCMALCVGVCSAAGFNVATYADLCKVGTGMDGWTLDASYVQTADIQCPAGENFTPIGSTSYPFTGNYDGQNYTILGMDIIFDGYDNIGMFSIIEGATLTNIVLNDVIISGDENVGTLVGTSVNSTITNCHTTGRVEGTTCVGGIVGFSTSPEYNIENFTVNECTSSVQVTGSMKCGGAIGELLFGSVSDTYVSGNISGNNTGGGLIGFNRGLVTRCSATGSVSIVDGQGYISGGLIGDNSEGSVSESYATGDVIGC